MVTLGWWPVFRAPLTGRVYQPLGSIMLDVDPLGVYFSYAQVQMRKLRHGCPRSLGSGGWSELRSGGCRAALWITGLCPLWPVSLSHGPSGVSEHAPAVSTVSVKFLRCSLLFKTERKVVPSKEGGFKKIHVHFLVRTW